MIVDVLAQTIGRPWTWLLQIERASHAAGRPTPAPAPPTVAPLPPVRPLELRCDTCGLTVPPTSIRALIAHTEVAHQRHATTTERTPR